MWPTVIVVSIIAILVITFIGMEIYKKKHGKSSCSCGGSCGTCGMNCSSKKK